MTRKPVGFDLDMTLIDSRRAIMESFARVAADTGVAIDPAAVDRRLGIKLQDELSYWFPPGDIDDAVRIYRAHYRELLAPLTTTLPGAAQALAAVRASGARVVVITAKYGVTAQLTLEGAGLAPDELFADAHGPEKAAILTTWAPRSTWATPRRTWPLRSRPGRIPWGSRPGRSPRPSCARPAPRRCSPR